MPQRRSIWSTHVLMVVDSDSLSTLNSSSNSCQVSQALLLNKDTKSKWAHTPSHLNQHMAVITTSQSQLQLSHTVVTMINQNHHIKNQSHQSQTTNRTQNRILNHQSQTTNRTQNRILNHQSQTTNQIQNHQSQTTNQIQNHQSQATTN